MSAMHPDRFPSALWPSYAGPSWRCDLPVIDRSEGRYLVAEDGRRFLDMTSGLWNACYGLDRAELEAALGAQASTLAFCRHDALRHRPSERLADRLAALSSVPNARVFFCNSGSEANEAAVHFALRFHRAGGRGERWKVATLDGAFHGVTSRCLAMCGRLGFRRAMGPFPDGNFRLPLSDPAGAGDKDALLAEAARTMDANDPGTLALVLVEPVLGGGGIRIPPEGYLAGLRDLAHQRGALFGVDEVATGFWRTGTAFRSTALNLSPDILTVGKALSGGYFPMAATLVAGRVFDRIVVEAGEAVLVGHTTGAHPIGCAVALANLDELERRDAGREVGRLEADLRRALEALSSHPCVRDVRGVGAMFGVELAPGEVGTVRRAAPPVSDVLREALDRGVLLEGLEGNSVIGILPPYDTTTDEVALTARVIRDALDRARESGGRS